MNTVLLRSLRTPFAVLGALALTAASVRGGFAHAPLDQVDFMPIGDSITDGDSFPPGFRDDLRALLAAEPDHTFTFVGDTGNPPLQGHFQGGRETEDFYPPGFGNGWGNGTFDTTPALGPPGTPNLVAIHLGTNDLNSQAPPFAPYSLDHGVTLEAAQAGELAEYLLYLLRWQDGSQSADLQHIVLSLIIPIQGQAQDVEDFNDAVIAMSEDFAEGVVTGAPVRIALADHYHHFLSNPDLFTFGPGDWMFDNLHPNDVGYAEMAAIYDAAIVAAVDDLTPPAAVADLAVAEVDSNRVVLTFTASGDDGAAGQAARYDLRIAADPIDPLDPVSFALATQVTDEPAPAAAGATETIEVTGLLPGNTVYLALKVVDGGGNRSAISNPVEATTTGTPTVVLTLREGLNGYFGSGDNSMLDFRSQDNLGSSVGLAIGKHGSGAPLVTDVQRTLIRFDLAQIPASATILDARLQLYNDAADSPAPVEAAIYRLTKHWMEGSQSAPAPENGASCWSAARLGELAWSAPGADAASDGAGNDDPSFDRFATPEDVVEMTGTNTWYAWDLTQAVGHWVHGEWNNEGVLLRTITEADNSRRRFRASESTASQTLRPTLAVTYADDSGIGVAGAAPAPPVAARLAAARPSPFSLATTIHYQLDQPGHVRLRVFDAQGRVVQVLDDGARGAGRWAVVWDGRNAGGRRAPSGVYFYRLEAPGGASLTRKVVVAR